nr:alpha-hydroxy-acid oxidizing protein [Phosphitispora fastidiosa]
MKGFCRVCPACDGKACAGEVPGMGGVGTGAGFQVNLEALAKYKLALRTMHGTMEPDLSTSLFNKTISFPILAAPMTGTPYNMGGALSEREFIGTVISGARQSGTIGMSGDGADPSMYNSGVDAIKTENGWGIPFIKPRSNDEIRQRIKLAEEAGALAIGIDIDGAGLITMALQNQPVGPKTEAELYSIVKMTKLPFIIKGIMTADEAKIAMNVGAAAIVVSNHGGRILDHTQGVAQMLPEIAETVKDELTILADGGVRYGVDVLKLIALGADAVLIGRPLVTGAFGGGIDGIKVVMKKMVNELKQAMILTGCNRIEDINQNIIAG